MLKSSRSNSSQSNIARSLLVVAVWVLAAILSASSAFAETLYVSPTRKDGVKFGKLPSELLLQSAGSLQDHQKRGRVRPGWRPRLRRQRNLLRND